MADKNSSNILEKFLSLFLSSNDPEKEKQRQLRDIAKLIRKHKFKFMKPKGSEALPALAKYFFSIYKSLGPTQILVEHANDSNALKHIIIESTIPEKIQQVRENLSENVIQERADSTDLQTLADQVKNELITFISSFDSETVETIDHLYNLLFIFLQVVNFDYYFMLKKFDSRLTERDFQYKPSFEAINAEYISDDLKDFLSILGLLEAKEEWDKLFDILKIYKGTEVINRNAWKKLIRSLLEIRESRILEYIIKLTDKNPGYTVKLYPPNEAIVDDYLNITKTQAEVTLQKISKEKQNRKINTLLKKIFDTESVVRMKFYTEKANMSFSKKMLGGYIYIKPMHYLKGFLLDFFKKDIKEIVDLLIVRGKWSTNMNSQQLSEAYHAILGIAEALVKFDEELAEEGSKGSVVRNALKRADRDPLAMKSLRQLIDGTNNQAVKLINAASSHFIVMGKTLKIVMDDYNKKPHELIINWAELDRASDGHVYDKIAAVYQKIYYFVQLMQFFIKKEKKGS